MQVEANFIDRMLSQYIARPLKKRTNMLSRFSGRPALARDPSPDVIRRFRIKIMDMRHRKSHRYRSRTGRGNANRLGVSSLVQGGGQLLGFLPPKTGDPARFDDPLVEGDEITAKNTARRRKSVLHRYSLHWSSS